MAKSSGGKGSSSGGGFSGGDSSGSIGGREIGINLGGEGAAESSGLFSGVAGVSPEGGDRPGADFPGGDLASTESAVIDLGADVAAPFGGVGGEAGGVDPGRGGIIAARGTVDGLVIRVDGRVDGSTLRHALDEFVSARSSFLAGQEVFLEWVGIRPQLDVEEELTHLLKRGYGIVVKSVRLYSRPKTSDASLESSSDRRAGSGAASSGGRGREGSSLFEGARSFGVGSEGGSSRAEGSTFRASSSSAASVSRSGSRAGSFQSPISGTTIPWDEPDSRLIHANLRSGQKIESEHSLVIVGDVNSGAEVISGGDIVVLGTLRGVAHAGAYEESGGGRVIFAMNMQPTQLRIGSVISRGSAQDGKGASAEVARVDGSLIIVEPYQTKTLGGTSGGGLGSSIVGLLGRKRGVAG